MRLRVRMNTKVLAGMLILVLLAGVSSNSMIHIAFAQKPDPKEEKQKNQEELKGKTYESAKDAHQKTVKELEPYKGQQGATSAEDVKAAKLKDIQEKKEGAYANQKETHEKTTTELKPYKGQGGAAAEDIKAKKLKEKEALEEQAFSNAKESHEKTIGKLVPRR